MQRENLLSLHRTHRTGTLVNKENNIMATPIRPIPILTGEAAERFIRMADAAEKNPHTQKSGISEEEFKKFLAKAKFH